MSQCPPLTIQNNAYLIKLVGQYSKCSRRTNHALLPAVKDIDPEGQEVVSNIPTRGRAGRTGDRHLENYGFLVKTPPP